MSDRDDKARHRLDERLDQQTLQAGELAVRGDRARDAPGNRARLGRVRRDNQHTRIIRKWDRQASPSTSTQHFDTGPEHPSRPSVPPCEPSPPIAPGGTRRYAAPTDSTEAETHAASGPTPGTVRR